MKRRYRKSRPSAPADPALKFSAQLAVRVPGELAVRLRRYCQESGRSFNEIVGEALERYLNQKKQ